MNSPTNILKQVLLFAILSVLTGCMPAFLLTTEGHAKRIHKQMQAIYQAALDYKAEHGSLPYGTYLYAKNELISGGYIKRYPRPYPAIFGPRGPMKEYRFDPQYDRMDAGPSADSAIAVWGLKDEICMAFNNRYSSNQSGPTIYDWEAAGKKYPGETLGHKMRIYAIKWETAAIDDCEINWVLEYSE